MHVEGSSQEIPSIVSAPPQAEQQCPPADVSVHPTMTFLSMLVLNIVRPVVLFAFVLCPLNL